MIEVLERKEPKKHKIKCCHCSSVLQFTHLDEEEDYDPDVPFEGQASTWLIKCPNCNRRVPTRSLTDKGYYDWMIE